MSVTRFTFNVSLDTAYDYANLNTQDCSLIVNLTHLANIGIYGKRYDLKDKRLDFE